MLEYNQGLFTWIVGYVSDNLTSFIGKAMNCKLVCQEQQKYETYFTQQKYE